MGVYDMKIIYKYVKRVFGFLIAFTLLVLLFPIMVIVGVLIKLDSKGPVFFKQERSGKDNKVFSMYKFRSMVADNDVMDFKVSDRTTRVGYVLRKTSIDELPQLINILKGEMSFIGPRPWITEYSKYFSKRQMHRLDVLPGITGLAQCEGRNGISVQDKINYDLKYVENISLKMDIYIIFKTVLTVFTGKDACANKGIIRDELNDLKNQFKKKNKVNNRRLDRKKNEGCDKYEESLI